MMSDKTNLDLSILKIALLLTALDGHVDDSEYDMFTQLASACHIVSGDDVLKVLDSMKRPVEELVALAKEGDEKKLLAAFVSRTDSVCDWVLFANEPELPKQAFAMWTAMAMADDDYCETERKAIRLLQARINAVPRVNDAYLDLAERSISELRRLHQKLAKVKTTEEKVRIRARGEELMSMLE